MNFSIFQWLICIAVDLLLKAVFMYFVGAITLGAAPISVFMWMALELSLFHFLSLLVARIIVASFELRRFTKVALTLIVANFVFISGFFLEIMYDSGQDLGRCVAGCLWTNGHVNPDVVLSIAAVALILLVMNLVPIMIAAGFGLFSRPVAPN